MKKTLRLLILIVLALASLAGTAAQAARLSPDSIVDELIVDGEKSTKEARAALAEKLGVSGYDFSAAKNIELLAKYKESKTQAWAASKETQLVPWLDKKGIPSSKAARKALAKEHGIEGYNFSMAKNIALLRELEKAQQPVATPAVIPASTTPKMETGIESELPKKEPATTPTEYGPTAEEAAIALATMLSNPPQDMTDQGSVMDDITALIKKADEEIARLEADITFEDDVMKVEAEVVSGIEIIKADTNSEDKTSKDHGEIVGLNSETSTDPQPTTKILPKILGVFLFMIICFISYRYAQKQKGLPVSAALRPAFVKKLVQTGERSWYESIKPLTPEEYTYVETGTRGAAHAKQIRHLLKMP